MRILFLHQNFPGQFKHLAPARAAAGHEVVALPMRRGGPSVWQGVRVLPYWPARGSAPGVHRWLTDLETKAVRAEACARHMMRLREAGFVPDVVVAHPGWGESLGVKTVWPTTRLGIYCELYYQPSGADVGFDPEFAQTDPLEAMRLRFKNLNHDLHFELADAALAPTRWQASTFPEPFRQRIHVVHDGIDTAALQPRADACFTLPDGRVLTRADEVVTFVARNLEPYRGFHIFMRALPELLHLRPRAQVLLVEHNPAAGIKNNVLGTLRTAQAAAENGVSDFVLISTDKAVRPTNVMGASKRLAEMALQALTGAQTGTHGGTKFSMVRFGNVLGSSGSVVPKFRQQIRDGGPITLTHPEVTRYFMTIPEAAQLVIQAGAMAKGGDVFVLDMGQPVKIMDLARRMVELSGLTVKDGQHPEGDIEIAVTGLRPGEKLYEELLIGDNPKPTVHPRIMKAHEEFLPWAEFEAKLTALEMALNVNDVGVIRLMMQQLVAGYIPGDDIVDWVYLEQEAEAQALGVAS